MVVLDAPCASPVSCQLRSPLCKAFACVKLSDSGSQSNMTLFMITEAPARMGVNTG
jgi:hypothetical protein